MHITTLALLFTTTLAAPLIEPQHRSITSRHIARSPVVLDIANTSSLPGVRTSPAGRAGAFEVEFQSAQAGQVLTQENTSPAAPPAGFAAVESSSFIVQFATSGTPTLQKIDYIFDVTDSAVAALDLATTKIGKLSADGCSFAIEEGLEFEFEAEENEITLTVDDLNGEWAAEGAAAGEAEAAKVVAAKGAGAAGKTAME
ncbi:uncharacterized protein AB675_11596 [Cyphellophora attinorum]|uniref:Ubiquitin 3 binding protein But2 C-terminal domain-containing protein n=1 Tax=Cyphellophora attinorum TaxID=1664694 RepID=A0A0N1H9J4_9EURO|nr:uncharacterized protein AB675_11596 [Phialophora attinorum]KPI40224.1 hypothetical protein AB675_11596 [Phialophora attinorum]